MNKKVPTLFGLQMAVKVAKIYGDPEVIRKAQENLRVFKYKQKPAFTASGHVIRH